MTTIIISPYNVATYAEGGGHFWVYMQYVQGLVELGCEVYWLEQVADSALDAARVRTLAQFEKQLDRFGLRDKLILYRQLGATGSELQQYEFLTRSESAARSIFRRADLLLNFHYAIQLPILDQFARTSLIDIDPGLLSFWLSHRQLSVEAHDLYFTTGETVGTPQARFPDPGLPWRHIRPPVSLSLWSYKFDPKAELFTTVSGWWGLEWITDGTRSYDNTKRASFLEFVEVAQRTSQRLELALLLGASDTADVKTLRDHGWAVRHASEVASTPEQYQRYVQSSRGEFSCAKPSCMDFQNAWISDRTLCYLASGKPAVVQHTGPSSYLPNGRGLFRFSTIDEAVAALANIDLDYPRHCAAAREIAETYFDARSIVEQLLNEALE